MSKNQETQEKDKKNTSRASQQVESQAIGAFEQGSSLPMTVQQAQAAPQSLAPRNVLQLQRALGNQAVNSLLVQRHANSEFNEEKEEEKLVQTKRDPMVVQRHADEEETAQRKTIPSVQRHANSEFNEEKEEEKLVQTKRDPNAGPARAVASASVSDVVQRTVWTRKGDKWVNDAEEEGVPAKAVKGNPVEGDKFDDVKGQLYSSGNVAFKGAEGSSWGKTTYGDVPAEVEAKLRQAIVLAKMALASAKQKILDATYKVGADQAIDAGFMTALSLAFNISPDVGKEAKLKILNIVFEGVNGIAKGLDKQDVPIIKAAEKVKILWKEMDMSDAAGYVQNGFGEAFGDRPKRTDTGQFFERSGDIHINWGMIDNPAVTAKTIIHEASHKFLGTWDFTYGVSNSEGTASWLADQAEAMDTDEAGAVSNMMWDSFAKVVRLKVEEANPAGPIKVKAFNLQNQLAGLAGNVARKAKFDEVIDELAANVALPQAIRTQLTGFKDRETILEFIAQNGNTLGLKGPSQMFILPTEYLMNNADSYMDLVDALK